jgi:hypothetical protein
MKRYTLLGAVLLTTRLMAQTISLGTLPNPICTGASVSVPFSTAGAFQNGNEFRLQLKPFASNAFLEFTGETVGNALRVRFDNLTMAEYLRRGHFEVRIVSTQPVVASPWSPSFPLLEPASVSLLGGAPEVMNAFDSFDLNFRVSGTAPLFVTLGDSTRLRLGPSYYDGPVQTVQATVYPEKTTTYTIVRAENGCGTGQGSGSATARVNELSVVTLAPTPRAACLGSTVYVGYSLLNGAFGTGNTFKVRLSKTDYAGKVTTRELDATEENGQLRFTLPLDFPYTPNSSENQYSVAVVATNPAVVAAPSPTALQVYPAPGVEFSTGSRTVRYGESAPVQLRFQGLSPYAAELSNGTVVRSLETYSGPVFGTINVSPPQTTSYTIRSFRSGCGTGPVPSTSVLITVLPGAAADSLPTTQVCEGQTIAFRLSGNVPLNGTVQVSVRREIDGWVSIGTPAQVQNGVVNWTVPSLPDYAGEGRNFSVLVNGNGFSAESSQKISIPTKPGAFFNSYDQAVTIGEPAQFGLSYSLSGGGPYTVAFNDGTVAGLTEPNGYLTVRPLQTTTYTLRSVSNACGTSNPNSQARVTVQRPAAVGINLDRTPLRYCLGDSLAVGFTTVGEFRHDNAFRIQASGPGGTWTDLKVIQGKTGGTINVASTQRQDPLLLRVVSTNPVTFSEERRIGVLARPNARFTSLLPTLEPSLPGELRSVFVYVNGGGNYRLTYTDGQRDFTARGLTYSVFENQITLPVQPTATTTYSLKAIANECGTGTVESGAVRTTVVPFRLVWPLAAQISGGAVCVDNRTALAFATDGSAGPETRYTLQIATANDTTFTDLVRDASASPFLVTWPRSLAPGSYRVRVVSSNPRVVSPTLSFLLSAKPTALLTAENGASTLNVPANGAARLRVTLTGSPYWAVWFSDGVKTYYNESPSTYFLTPERGGVYRLRAVTNGCGYGTVSGEVRLNVAPGVQATVSGSGVVCAGQTLAFNYTARGDFEAGNRIVFALHSPQTGLIRLDSTTRINGPVSLPLPGNLLSGNYELRVFSTKPVATATQPVQIIALPRYVLSGSTTINPGGAALLRLRPPGTPTSQTIQYTLSDGTQGQFNEFGQGTFLRVTPTQTTTYSVLRLSNQCGTGQASGQAVVTVNPPAERTVEVTNVENFQRSPPACAGDSIRVSFETRGGFSAGNAFTVQLSDSTGSTFSDLPTAGTRSPLRAFVPPGTVRGDNYRVRVRASDPGTGSGAYASPVSVRQRATARFDSAVTYYFPGKNPKLLVRFTGDSPWTYTVGTDFNSRSWQTSRNPDTLTFTGGAPLTVYKLSSLSNACGPGRIEEPSTVRVELITATEPRAGVRVRAFPNPTTGRLRVEPDQPGPFGLTLFDARGRVLVRHDHVGMATELELSAYPAGAYLLRVEQQGQRVVFKLLKN